MTTPSARTSRDALHHTVRPCPSSSRDPAIAADNSTLAANPTSGLLANGSDSSTITVTINDFVGLPLANVPVMLSASNGALGQTTVMTNASGVA